jgi:outer membrane protein assembly factor BamB/predicted phosphodiesterase
MRRQLGCLLAVLALMISGIIPMAGGRAQNAPAAVEPDSFTFLDISDTHQGAGEPNANLRKLAEDAAQMSPKPAFVIHTGDVTDSGKPEEYVRFREATAPLREAGIKIYAVPGNHDVRWSPDGKESFAREFGKTYQSFDHGGAHFLLLDTSVMLEHWGHLDKAELDWLARDLKKVKPETPIFVFMHHWIGRDTPATRMVDNEYDLINQLRNRNVVAIFTGHNHKDLAWQTSGIRTLMAEAMFMPHGSYYHVNVSKLLVTIDRQFANTPGDSFHATLPIARQSRPSRLKAEWDDPDNPFLSRRRPQASLNPRAVTDNPDREMAEYRTDEGPYRPLIKDKRDFWHDQFETKDIPVGVHTADVRLTTSNNVAYSDELIFEIERDNREPTQKWAINLEGPIQSSPLLLNDLLYVSSLDGKCCALELARGKKRWTFPTKGQFFASPIIDGSTLYIGNTDHEFYALDAMTGKERWHYNTGSPIFGTAAVAQGIVCVGGAGKIYGLDVHTGKPRWTQPAGAGSFFQSRAGTDGSTFYLGGWDNTLYALDAVTGTPRWAAHMGYDKNKRLSFFYSPAISSPAIVDGRVYICSNDGVLHALNAQSGKELWTTFAPPGADSFGYSSPAVAGPNIFVAGLGQNGDVYCLNAMTGHINWRVPTGQIIYDSSPRLSPDGKSLAIMAVRGHISVLDCGTGKRLWGYEMGPGNIFSTPEYDGQRIYTTTMANDVQAINGPGVGGTQRREPRRPATPTTDAEETANTK